MLSEGYDDFFAPAVHVPTHAGTRNLLSLRYHFKAINNKPRTKVNSIPGYGVALKYLNHPIIVIGACYEIGYYRALRTPSRGLIDII